jgi:hypothetical protein
MQRERTQRAPRAIRRGCVLLLSAALSVPAVLRAEEERTEAASDLARKADDIRASADRLFKLQRVPWVTDVVEGFRLAREEQRPVLLYMITGDPLGDC